MCIISPIIAVLRQKMRAHITSTYCTYSIPFTRLSEHVYITCFQRHTIPFKPAFLNVCPLPVEASTPLNQTCGTSRGRIAAGPLPLPMFPAVLRLCVARFVAHQATSSEYDAREAPNKTHAHTQKYRSHAVVTREPVAHMCTHDRHTC